MVVHGLGRDHEALGDVGVAQALGKQRQHLELARGQTCRIGARPGTRTSRQVPHAAVAQPPCDDRLGGLGAERLQSAHRRALGPAIVCLGERQRRLVGASELLPSRGCLSPFAGDLERVGSGRFAC